MMKGQWGVDGSRVTLDKHRLSAPLHPFGGGLECRDVKVSGARDLIASTAKANGGGHLRTDIAGQDDTQDERRGLRKFGSEFCLGARVYGKANGGGCSE